MKTVKILGAYTLVIVTLLLAIDTLNRYEPRDFSTKGNLADKSRFWAKRAEAFRASAGRESDRGKLSFARIDVASAANCEMKAEYYKGLHNRELGVSLWRSLALIGTAPEASEYFRREYEMRKL